MRHKVSGRHLGRTSAHRVALKRNLAASLFEHGAISTTKEKAKFVKPFAEKLITLAKDGSLAARRRAISLLRNRDICKVEDGEPVKVTTVIQKLFSEIGPRFAERKGGYTRIINLPLRRLGDNGQLVLLQLVEDKKAALTHAAKDVESVSQDTNALTDTAEQKIENQAEAFDGSKLESPAEEK
jgi:large subunit ribosomal protein L17